MRTFVLICAACILTGCSTVGAGKKVVKTTGKVAQITGKAVYKTGEATGKAVYKTGEVAGKTVYKTGEATGRAVVGIGKKSAAMINKTTSHEIVQDVTLSPMAKDINSVGDKATFREAMLTPLSDINLRKQRIPKKLTALQTPYDEVSDKSCRGLDAEIVTLDTILGPDMDSVIYESRDVKDKRQIRETSLDVAEAGVGSFVPFRGLVRAATGAKKHNNEVQRQYRKGVARRSYLRGLAAERGCSTR